MKHLEHLTALGDLAARCVTAVDMLTQLATEAEGKAHWEYMASRTLDLQKRLGRICEEAQVIAFERRGLYNPPPLPAKVVRAMQPRKRKNPYQLDNKLGAA